jgi:pyruvate formate lyase activating enzyme
MKEAILYDRLDGLKVKCNVCQVRCIIQDQQRGWCGTRLNKDGKLYSLIYGLTSSVCVDPIEKKPLYHFYPASRCLSLGALGCNFKCPGCQNWHLSHQSPDEFGKNMERLTPEDSILIAKKYRCLGISWTYNEPAIWLEQILETLKMAKKEGFYTVYVTNGYSSPEALDAVGPYLTGYRVDIKGFSKDSYKKVSGIANFEGILEVAKLARHKWGMHVECVTNVTPTINDEESILRGIARWIREELGEFTPWHVTRFYPHLDLSHLSPTPIRTMERAYEIGRQEGLKYVYVGNLPGHRWEDTYCHGCGERIISRSSFYDTRIDIKGGKCPSCGTQIPGRWDYPEHVDPPTFVA